jgi:phosphate:Na+ symporter
MALAVMLGADVGTSLVTVLFSFDLSWLSPLLIFSGVVLFISRPSTNVGRFGRVLIGLGLMLLALRLISEATQVMVQSPVVRALLASINSDLLLEITLGAVLALLSYSSLAIVLLTATLAATGIVPHRHGAGAGAGRQPGQRHPGRAHHVALGGRGAARAAGQPGVQGDGRGARGALHRPVAHLGAALFRHHGVDGGAVPPEPEPGDGGAVPGHRASHRPHRGALAAQAGRGPTGNRPHHLDPSALATPSLAISCAAREALHQADIVETMLLGVLTVIRNNDLRLAEELRKLDDTVDELYSAIKYYLTKISREALGEEESRRWTDIISFTINMEQIGDTIERILIDIEDKKIRKGRSFSEAGMAEICELHARLVDNLRLGMSVFLNGSVRDAQKLLEEKARFRDLEHAYAASHIERLSGNTVQSIETSSLHIDLISDLKRINSHICSIAYPILESAGALAPSRLRSDVLAKDGVSS